MGKSVPIRTKKADGWPLGASTRSALKQFPISTGLGIVFSSTGRRATESKKREVKGGPSNLGGGKEIRTDGGRGEPSVSDLRHKSKGSSGA